MGKNKKFFKAFLILFIIFFFFPKEILGAVHKQSDILDKILEFIALIIEIFIKFLTLIQEFISLVIKFFEWLKNLILGYR